MKSARLTAPQVNVTILELAAAPALEMRRHLNRLRDVDVRRILTLAHLGELEMAKREAPPTPAEILSDLLTKDLPTLEKFISDLRLAIWSDDFARRATPR